MSKKKTQLALSDLPAVFGVSSMSVYLWRQGTPTKEALEEPFTPSRLRGWAKRNGRPIARSPDLFLGPAPAQNGKGRPSNGKRAASASKKLVRSASGKLTGVRQVSASR